MATADFKITNNKKKNSNHQKLVFEGDLSIFNSDRVLKKTKRFKVNSAEVVIELKNVNGFDLSTVQLIVALTKTIKKDNNKVTVIADLPKEKMNLLEVAALDSYFKN